MSRKISDYFPKLASKIDKSEHKRWKKDENGNSVVKSSTSKQFYDHNIIECRVVLKDIFKSNVKLWAINLESPNLNKLKEKSPKNDKTIETRKFSVNLMDIRSECPGIEFRMLENIEIDLRSHKDVEESAVESKTVVNPTDSTRKSSNGKTTMICGLNDRILNGTAVDPNPRIEISHPKHRPSAIKIKLPKKSRKNKKTKHKNHPRPKDIETSTIPSTPALSIDFYSPSQQKTPENIKHDPKQHFTIILPPTKPNLPQPEPMNGNYEIKVEPETPRQLPKYTKFRDVSDKFTKLGPKKFQCSICQKVIKTEFNLGTHLAAHTKVKPKCDKCQKSFHNRYKLEIHVCEATSKFCGICKRSFSYTSSYRLHMKTFHPELVTQRMMECDICGERFFKKKGISYHINARHVGKYGQYICDYDGKMFSSRNYIYNHMKHHTSKYVKCELCSSEMKEISYKQHLVTMHNDREFKCKMCSKSFKNLAYLNLHQKYHVKKFRCDSCGKKFANNFEVARHVKNFHENPRSISCEICGNRFHTNYVLKWHMKLHLKDRPMPFQCQKCQFKTDKNRMLKLHMEGHQKLEEKFSKMQNPVKCEKCWMNFRNEKDVEKHMRSVHPEKLFECDFCGQKIKIIHNLYRHIKRCHNRNI